MANIAISFSLTSSITQRLLRLIIYCSLFLFNFIYFNSSFASDSVPLAEPKVALNIHEDSNIRTTQQLSADGLYKKPNLYGKINLGYIKPNNYDDYTSGTKDLIHNTQASSSPLIGIEIGHILNDNLRAGLSIEYNSHSFKAKNQNQEITREIFIGYDTEGFPHTGQLHPFSTAKLKIKTTALLLNFYYNLHKYNNIQPYLILGLGTALHKSSNYVMNTTLFANHADINITAPGRTKASFAYNVGISTQLPIDEQFYFDASIKYFDYGKTATKNKLNVNNNVFTGTGVVGAYMRGMAITTSLVFTF